MAVKPAEDMSLEMLTAHLNHRHMPMRGAKEGIALTYVPNMTEPLRKVWLAWHAREHAAGSTEHEHVAGE